MTDSPPYLNTVTELVRTLGGDGPLAKELNIGRSAVKNWRLRDKIPAAQRFAVFRLCQRNGFRVAPELLGERPER